MTRVLIAVDETEQSVHAAAVARRLFGDDADYVAVSVADANLELGAVPWWTGTWGVAYPVPYGAAWPLPGAVSPRRDVPEADMPTAADVAERTAREAVEATGLEAAEVIGEVGDPVDAIEQAAAAHDADVVVVGSHERGWLDRLFHGSVSKDLIAQLDRPVLIIK